MARDYKFRAWHTDAEMMLYEHKVGDAFRWKNEGQPIEIMQYTGEKDRNGEGIFEGDIYRTADGRDTGIIKYENARFYIDWLPPVTYGLRSELHYVDDGEVIGNVHADPHLLQEQGEKE